MNTAPPTPPGRSESSVVREAVSRYLEDIEDVALVNKSRAAGGRARSIAWTRRLIGLN